MKLIFVRHGQSTNNLLWETHNENETRVEDPLLTEKGKKQATLVASFIKDQLLKEFNINVNNGLAIYCSLMIRAIETGLEISNTLQLPLFAYPDIHEVGGIYLADENTGEKAGLAGKTRSYFIKTYPTLFISENMPDIGWWGKRMEDRSSAYIRAVRVLKNLREMHSGRDEVVIFVSHGGFYNELMKASLGLDNNALIWFELKNTAMSMLEFSKNSVEVIFCNWFDFLPDEMRS